MIPKKPMPKRLEPTRKEKMDLVNFVRESNKIERINRDPTEKEIEAHKFLLNEPYITVEVLEHFVDQIEPGIKLRDQVGRDIYIAGRYECGRPEIRTLLTELLQEMPDSPYIVHHKYERLHPFMDGNGRSGRALWLWQCEGHAPLGFLRTFYYQALAHGIETSK